MSAFLTILSRLADGETLSVEDAETAFETVMSGGADLAQMAAFAMALRVRGETVNEIVGGAKVLRSKAATVQIPDGAVDTCGTGGDGLGTYNISTAAALVCASAGIPVAKHGNKSVSSKSGSADVLSALGANLDMPLVAHQQSLEQHGFTFLFAPKHHQAMRHAAPVRGSLKLRTIFNLLGPLANPGAAKRQVLGVFDRQWVRPMAEVLKALGSQHVWVVHGEDGLDELTISGSTFVSELKNGEITDFIVSPADAGLDIQSLDGIKGGDADENAAALRSLLEGAKTPYRDIVLLNAAAAFVVAGHANDLRSGVRSAADVIDSGKALETLLNWVQFTTSFGEISDNEGPKQ